VAHKDYRSLLKTDNTPRDRDVVFQRYRWILDNTDAVAIFLQDLIDALSARAVHEPTVDEHD
jgi:hypothetical protein